MTFSDSEQIEEEIRRAEAQLVALHQRKIQILERELASSRNRYGSALSAGAVDTAPAKKRGRKPGATNAGAAAPAKKAGKKRARRMSSEDARQRLLETIKAAGKDGIALKELSDRSGVSYQSAIRVLKDMSGDVTKKGKSRSAHYVAKG